MDEANGQSKMKGALTLLLLHLAHPFLDFVFLFLPLAAASTKLFNPGSAPVSTDDESIDDANLGIPSAPTPNLPDVVADALLFLIERRVAEMVWWKLDRLPRGRGGEVRGKSTRIRIRTWSQQATSDGSRPRRRNHLAWFSATDNDELACLVKCHY